MYTYICGYVRRCVVSENGYLSKQVVGETIPWSEICILKLLNGTSVFKYALHFLYHCHIAVHNIVVSRSFDSAESFLYVCVAAA